MSYEIDITGTCYHCKGAGQVPVYTDPYTGGSLTTCPICGGDGVIELTKIDLTQLMDAIGQVQSRCDEIWDVIPDGWKQ